VFAIGVPNGVTNSVSMAWFSLSSQEGRMPGIARMGGAAFAVIALAICALEACQPAHDAANGSDSTAVASAPAAPSAPVIVTVHARDYAFDAPDQVPAGMTTFRMVNDGPALHHVTLIRLDSAKTPADLQAAMQKPGPLPGWAVLSGGPNAVEAPNESTATVDLVAGNYLMICFVDLPSGPHFMKGMVRPLTVVAATTPGAPAPTADVVLTLSDYQFGLSHPLTAGPHTIRVDTKPGQPHEMVLVRLDPGKTQKDLGDWMQKMKGPPPGHVVGGASPSTAGAPVYVSVNLAAGKYVLICFLPDATDGKPHAAHGMMLSADVA
jgi:hypothetical protein